MVKIRQHGENGRLNDMSSFLRDIDEFFRVDSWSVQVEWCSGDDALAIEEATADGMVLSDEAFRKMYRGIFQTIDGEFAALAQSVEVCRLLAVDSSYWEVSGSPEFEGHMLSKYGAYAYRTHDA